MIGLGRLGQEIMSKVSRDFDITCVSMEPDAEGSLKRLKREDVELIVGDATSRLVLEKCRIDEADAVIITITTEKISREVATVLKDHFNPRRVISVAVTGETTDELLEMGFEVDNIFASTATDIRNRIEHKTRAAHAIGIGKDEILEVEVHPQSRLANKPLGFVKPLNWRIGILYREGNIIIPKGDTVMKPRDRVIILGDPQVLRTVSEIMTFNYQKFPLEYGDALIAYLSGRENASFIEELNYVYSTFPFRKAWILRSERASAGELDSLMEGLTIKDPVVKTTSLSPMGAIKAAVGDTGGTQGMVMVSSEFLDSYYSGFLGVRKKSFIREILAHSRCPVIISKGTVPYKGMVVPCVGDVELDQVIETSLQISEEINNRITAIQVPPSRYISGSKEDSAYKEARSIVASMALVYKSKVDTLEVAGNPIKAVMGALEGHDLLVTSMPGEGGDSLLSSLFRPDVVWGIVRSSVISTLVMPFWEETI